MKKIFFTLFIITVPCLCFIAKVRKKQNFRHLIIYIASQEQKLFQEFITVKTEQLIEQPKWTFFIGWSELEFKRNSNEQIQIIHSAPNVITLYEMPGWK